MDGVYIIIFQNIPNHVIYIKYMSNEKDRVPGCLGCNEGWQTAQLVPRKKLTYPPENQWLEDVFPVELVPF